MNSNNHRQLLPQQAEILSATSIALYWRESIDVRLNQTLIACTHMLRQHFAGKITDIICSYSSLLIELSPPYTASTALLDDICSAVDKFISSYSQQAHYQGQHHVIDVYYGTDSGWDLALVSEQTGISVSEVIKRHSQPTYHVFANGFMPGFAYLGIVDKTLQLPRKATPRLQIPQGAVAIADQQTAVYPYASPGGWLILGQTAHSLMNKRASDPQSWQPRLLPGDSVRFRPIDKQQFASQGGILMRENKGPESRR
ncbi:allophanate hydrolase subunit 1 [Thalassotalea maritima]|uniref:5-oxoprolinase subunit B family protein n=1 Tax=Thalassotalea maritima TaxID=3242416 RepID=UPI00352805FA